MLDGLSTLSPVVTRVDASFRLARGTITIETFYHGVCLMLHKGIVAKRPMTW